MTELQDREWRVIPEAAAPGALQMAFEEVAAETAVNDGIRTVRVYQWEPSTLSLGYRQDADSVDWGFCERNGIDVTRRQTGGGGIYHDTYADISYSIVAPAEELPGDLMDCYELLCEPVLDAFDRLDIDARFADSEHPSIHQPACYLRKINPAHDILAYDADEAGKKISGNAQYRQRDAVIQHGSLSYDRNVDQHLGTFADPECSPATFRERVTSISDEAAVSRDRAVEAVETALSEWCDATVGEWTAEERDRATELAATKYDDDRWVRDRTDPVVQ